MAVVPVKSSLELDLGTSSELYPRYGYICTDVDIDYISIESDIDYVCYSVAVVPVKSSLELVLGTSSELYLL